MYWNDEGYLLAKNNFDENSIIIEAFTLNHGKCSGIVYGGSSRKNKRNFQIGNKILLNYKTKNENKLGYFSIELIKPIAPLFFDNKKKTICILAASSILKILLPEHQINEKIYNTYENFLNQLEYNDWIKFYIFWELSLVKELGFATNFLEKKDLSSPKNYTIDINDKIFTVPKMLLEKGLKNITNIEIKKALIFNKNLLIENFIFPNRLKIPTARNILEKYFD